MTTITLIRHGQASFGASNYDRLSPLGIRQSEVLGAHFARLGTRFDAAFSGEMSRQQDTAAAALAPMEQAPVLNTEPAFNEYDADALFKAYLPGVLNQDKQLAGDSGQLLQDRRVFQKAFERIIESWVAGEPAPDAALEPFADFVGRVTEGLNRVVSSAAPKDRLAIFTSGGPISVAVRCALELSDRKTFAVNWRVANASLTEINYGRGGFSLTGFNNYSHLQLADDDGLVTWR